MLRNSPSPATPPVPLAAILAEMAAAGVRISPLSVIGRLTDIGADDDAVADALDQLASARGLEDAA